jgi:voltage-gated potassium channel
MERVDELLHAPMIALSFFWIGLLVLDLTMGLNTFLTWLMYLIWAIFALDFLLEFLIAPHKLAYLRAH